MTDIVAALDIGGTKAHLVVETVQGVRLVNRAVPSSDWDAEPADRAADWLGAKLKANLAPDVRMKALAVGAQGVNRVDIGQALEAALATRGYDRVRVVNDASLIVPAAGFDKGIGIIAGTGAIGVGMDAAGKPLQAGGWGSVIGDEGGAAALVREAARAALKAWDEGRPDDGLLSALIADFGVADAERLTRRVNDEPTPENWAPHCPAVFKAADGGSTLAASVVEHGAACLAALVGQLLARGATGSDVAVAGSVIVNQDRLFAAFNTEMRRRYPALHLHRLTVAPVEGAVFLARRMLDQAG